MPNGISCAVFAARNHIYGKKEQNIFKEGIAHAQTARTIDSVTKTGVLKGPVATPVTNFFGKAAAIARKIVYPLIIGSGIYNTIKSDDKVKTGASQAAGIATMYAFEQVAERGIKSVSKKLETTNTVKTNKYARAGLYVLKGLTFVGASLTGYNVGSKAGEKMVDDARAKSNNKVENKNPFVKDDSKANQTTSEYPDKVEQYLFEDMVL